MQYYDPNKNSRETRRWALVALLLYLVAMVALLGLLVMELAPRHIPPPTEVVLDLGMLPEELELPELAEGEIDEGGEGVLAEGDVLEAGAPEVEGDVPVYTPKPVPPPPPEPEPKPLPPKPFPVQPKPAPPTPEPPRVVNPNALFHGAKQPTPPPPSPPKPEPSGDGEGVGFGSGDGSVTGFGGRALVGALPKPTYPPGNHEGRVAVDVTINSSGRVTQAVYRAQGSTTSNKALIDAALAAARRARFSEAEKMAETGTIVYTFKLN